MAVELFDYSYDRLTPAQIRAAGRVGVIRYVASGRPGVTATKAEVDGYRQAGLTFCGVWQNGKDRALDGREAGTADAQDAHTYTATLGAGPTDPVYFAVDFDAQPDQYHAVADYFRAAASVLGWHRVGAYAGLPVLDMLRAVTPLGLFWQTTSYSAGQVGPWVNLLQYAHNQTIDGAHVDYNRALTPDYGQWDRMELKSSPRGGSPVLWICLHTAEGPYDDDPANPSIDPGSVDQLRNYFADPNTQASCHAGADDDRLSDGWVPYDRAAWTLRNGNDISDNLEMCGRAGWTRAQWLGHPGLIRNAAKWAAGRCLARRIPPRRLTPAQVAARNITGIIDHNTYTVATGDGTHWDVGPGFPWDVFLPQVVAFVQGEDMPLTPADVNLILDDPTTWPNDGSPSAGKSYPLRAFTVGARVDAQKASDRAAAAGTAAAAAQTAAGRAAAAADRAAAAAAAASGQLTALTEMVAALSAKVDALAAAPPPQESGASGAAGDVQVTGTLHVGPVPSQP